MDAYRMLPVSATPEMLGVRVNPILRIGDADNTRVREWRAALWAAMVSAAPKVPAAAPKVSSEGSKVGSIPSVAGHTTDMVCERHVAFAWRLAQTIACSCGNGRDDRLEGHREWCEWRLARELASAVSLGVRFVPSMLVAPEVDAGFRNGWNACVEEMLGEAINDSRAAGERSNHGGNPDG